jgi:hypothetical protein
MITDERFPAVARAALWVCWRDFSISFSRWVLGWVVGFSVSVGEMGDVELDDDSEVDVVRVRS